jgi:hypothetical protein
MPYFKINYESFWTEPTGRKATAQKTFLTNFCNGSKLFEQSFQNAQLLKKTVNLVNIFDQSCFGHYFLLKGNNCPNYDWLKLFDVK